MKPKVKVQLLGKLSVSLNGADLFARAPQKTRELFAFLALHPGREHPREALATRLWGGIDEPRARKNLRQTIWHLRRSLKPLGPTRARRVLRAEPGWLRLETAEDIWTDVGELRSALARFAHADPASESEEALRSAASLYRGDLLEGWHQDWCADPREFCRDAYLALLDRLVEAREAAGDLEGGIQYAMRALEFDRARERTHRALMRLFVANGDRTGALRQYDRCVAAVREELNARPEEETVALMREIRSGKKLRGSGPAAAVPGAAEPAEAETLPARARRSKKDR
ncbi:MAG TPA: BTAD domain-containing putative transcriptional regulator [Candidatus Binatia bacterium]|nr:BTAD domain-containing putative transcriptional regulator [Candidatus Binatia bacterium]